MLSLELCKKLKDTGLSQPHILLRNYYTDEGHVVGGWQIEKIHDGFVLIPNLSDLIDASLQSFALYCQPRADSGSARGFVVCPEGGKDMEACNNAEEAVARLVLRHLEEMVFNEKKV